MAEHFLFAPALPMPCLHADSRDHRLTFTSRPCPCLLPQKSVAQPRSDARGALPCGLLGGRPQGHAGAASGARQLLHPAQREPPPAPSPASSLPVANTPLALQQLPSPLPPAHLSCRLRTLTCMTVRRRLVCTLLPTISAPAAASSYAMLLHGRHIQRGRHTADCTKSGGNERKPTAASCRPDASRCMRPRAHPHAPSCRPCCAPAVQKAGVQLDRYDSRIYCHDAFRVIYYNKITGCVQSKVCPGWCEGVNTTPHGGETCWAQGVWRGMLMQCLPPLS